MICICHMEADNERLHAMKPRLRLKRFAPTVGSEGKLLA